MTDFLFAQDTIVAISSPPGRGAVGMLRLSGPGIAKILRPHWGGKAPLESLAPRTLHFGKLTTGTGEVLDEGLLARMVAPASYTGEDMAEIHCHGNPRILADLFAELVASGARPAEPGEFTFRAFRNGKMSLAQAEAVGELIEARGEWARKNALAVLAENGGAWVRQLLDALLEIWAPIEADLEFPTDDLDSVRLEDYLPPLETLLGKIEDLDRRATRFSKLQEGFRVVIAGAPNAGKSSLLNALLGYNRALVTEIPGTTRDTLEEVFEIEGIPIRLIDTAGLGEARDTLDEAGMDRTRQALDGADLALVVVDASVREPEAVSEFAIPEGRPSLVVANKIDLLGPDTGWSDGDGIALVSATREEGLKALLEKIAKTLTEEGGVRLDERLMLNRRQAETLGRTREAVGRAIDNIRHGSPQDLVATDLIDAKNALEELSGKVFRLDLMGAIFSRFCVGK